MILKRKEEKLDPQIANQMLENVFAACRKEPNNIPLDVLASYSNYRQERFTLQKVLLIIVLVLFLLLPLLFFYPRIDIQVADGADHENPVYRVNVTGFMPVRRVNAVIGNRNVPIYEVGNGQYEIQPMSNGEMTVYVTFVNQQRSEKTVTVSSVDNTQPILLTSETDDEYVHLFVCDTDSGIDYEGVYVLAEGGQRIVPDSVYPETGEIRIVYPETTVSVYVPDRAGNVLQLLLSLQ